MFRWRRTLRSWKRDLMRLAWQGHLDVLPLRRELRGYSWNALRADARAGVNVALLGFPQAMAYAAIAGLPIEYGIYGTIAAALLGSLFFGSRFVVLGPTNATSVLLFTSFLALGIQGEAALTALPLVLVMSGLFLFCGALLQIANLVHYVSRTVIAGYITAAAVFIILNQLRPAIGLSFEIPPGLSLFGLAQLTLENLLLQDFTDLAPTLLVSLGSAMLYTLVRWRLPRWPHVALVLVVAMIATALFHDSWPFHLVETLSTIDVTTFVPTLPGFDFSEISRLAGVAMVLGFLSILEASAIGKSLSARSGQRIDLNQGMAGLGLANLGCGLLHGMPASGSLTRSQLATDTGARSSLVSAFGAASFLGIALLVGPWLRFVPKATLAVLVIAIGLALIDRHVLRIVLGSTRSDRIVFVVTFFGALFTRLDTAIVLGATTSIILFLRQAARPDLVEYAFDKGGQLRAVNFAHRPQTQEISIVHVEGDLFFGAADLFQDQVRRVCEEPDLRIVILKMRHAHHLDATSILALEELIKFLKESERFLLLSEIRRPALRLLKRSGLLDVVSRENVFLDDRRNPNLSTAHALRRALQLLGKEDAGVKIYAGS